MTPSSTIGPYRIVSKLGEGGMGAVYRARDTRLNRDVAIKVLPQALADDSARMQRFEREAQILGSLSHSNIATIYGIEQGAIVMEFVEGADLAGPLPVDTVIDYARQIAAGLEAAHERGVIHRDLKPANIRVTPEGVVKILDFGLARAGDDASQLSSAANPTISPTLSLAMTQAGMILGTAGYMSPEQARGKPVDRRADIWAYGVILYELLTGRSLFGGGETVTDTLAAVVLKDPDLSALPESTPPRLRKLVERCLRKDPKLRLRDIGEARILLDEPDTPDIQTVAAPPKRHPWPWIAAAAVSTVALLAISGLHFRETAPAPEPVRFTVPLPAGGVTPALNSMALLPDGRKLAFLASVHGGPAMLWIRQLDVLEAHALPGTEGASFPFWSPDSKNLAFGGGGALRRIDLAGGPPQRLCPTGANAPITGAWTADGTIYFPNGREGIFRVAQNGGDPVRVTKVDQAAGEAFHGYPYLLPDGRHLLAFVTFASIDQNAVYLFSLDGKEKKRVAASRGSFSYAPPLDNGKIGHLLVTRHEALMAQPVNAATMEPVGDIFPITDRIGSSRSSAFFTVSPAGILAFQSGASSGTREICWVDRKGQVISSLGPPKEYRNVSVSPDGSRIAYTLSENTGTAIDIWIHESSRNTTSRFTFDQNENADPVWSPDGTKLAYSSLRGGRYVIHAKDSAGAKPEEVIGTSDRQDRVCDWSQDGRYILFVRVGQKGSSLWVLSDPLDPAKRKSSQYLDEGHVATQGQFSPGAGPRWVAYTSDESKHGLDVFVESFPPGAGKYQISNAGGAQPRWRADGKELFYIAPDGKLMAVDVKTASRFEAGVPKVLFDPQITSWNARLTFYYDVAPDGQRFLITRDVKRQDDASKSITVVLNWLAAVKR